MSIALEQSAEDKVELVPLPTALVLVLHNHRQSNEIKYMLTLSTDTLRSVLALSEKRDAFLAEMEKLNSQIEAIAAGKGSVPAGKMSKPPKAANKSKSIATGKRGKTKDAILALLSEAGTMGLSVTDAASKLGNSVSTINVWFATNGKKLGIKRIDTGVYALGR